jgi:hypothetical protein
METWIMEENEKTYIWEGAVGVRISERTNRTTGERFHSFEFVRCYKTEDSDEMKYASNFTERNAEALGRVIKKTLQYIAESNSSQDQEVTSNGSYVLGKIDVVKVPADQVAG